MSNKEAIKFQDALAAASRFNGLVTRTPLLESRLLNEKAGRRVLVKAECLQQTGSFKFRGGMSAVTQLSAEQRRSGVVAYSSGNHAQGVALAAKLAQVEAVIVMPSDAPRIKLTNTRRYGAEIVLYDRAGGESREQVGAQIVNERGLYLIKPYDNAQVIAGQATCGIEIAEQADEAGVREADVLVCCGGGGLTSGIAISLEAKAPDMTVRPVEPEHYDDVIRSQLSGKREFVSTNEPSICDAIVTPAPGELTFPIIQRLCGSGIRVTDEEAIKAIGIIMKYLKIIAEPGGAVALAAALFHPEEVNSDTVICTVSGGNADDEMIKQALTACYNTE